MPLPVHQMNAYYADQASGNTPEPRTKTEKARAGFLKGAHWLRDYTTALKHGRTKPFSEVERKVREATRNVPYGAHGALMEDLVQETRDPQARNTILAVIEQRLGYPPTKWRNVYKSMALLEYLAKKGHPEVARRARAELVPVLQDLQRSFHYVSPNGKDEGINVRTRAKALAALLQDDERLAQERTDAQNQRGKLDMTTNDGGRGRPGGGSAHGTPQWDDGGAAGPPPYSYEGTGQSAYSSDEEYDAPPPGGPPPAAVFGAGKDRTAKEGLTSGTPGWMNRGAGKSKFNSSAAQQSGSASFGDDAFGPSNASFESGPPTDTSAYAASTPPRPAAAAYQYPSSPGWGAATATPSPSPVAPARDAAGAVPQVPLPQAAAPAPAANNLLDFGGGGGGGGGFGDSAFDPPTDLLSAPLQETHVAREVRDMQNQGQAYAAAANAAAPHVIGSDGLPLATPVEMQIIVAPTQPGALPSGGTAHRPIAYDETKLRVAGVRNEFDQWSLKDRAAEHATKHMSGVPMRVEKEQRGNMSAMDVARAQAAQGRLEMQPHPGMPPQAHAGAPQQPGAWGAPQQPGWGPAQQPWEQPQQGYI
ncbi:unnamed protein product [Pedinophyceae sp. YPF-701]|nr:unnamed protein product [Pedinophyceae sp. YPF-701]